MFPLKLFNFPLKIRVVLTGGGTGGHIFPLLAVAQELQDLKEKQSINVQLYYMGPLEGPVAIDPAEFAQHGIIILPIASASPNNAANPIEKIKSVLLNIKGTIQCVWHLWRLMPDAIFSKGGFGAVPVLAVGSLYRIPILIHESDVIPGSVNALSKKFATRIAISFEKTISYFPYEKTALVGNPIRKIFFTEYDATKARETLALASDAPVVFFSGGSQGAQSLNEIVMNMLPNLVERYNIIHQCGTRNYPTVSQGADFMLKNNQHRDRYKLFGFLNEEQTAAAYACADLIVARAGSGTIFEIAAMGKPSILIPFPFAAHDHQRENAYAYASTGAAIVLEEENIKPHIIFEQIKMLVDNTYKKEHMAQAARAFAKPDAAQKIAQELLRIAKGTSDVPGKHIN